MFISEAYAQAASGAAAQPGGLESMFSSFGVMILIFAVFWFLLIRPQQKRQKEHKKMIDSLTTGNEVITAGSDHFISGGKRSDHCRRYLRQDCCCR